jgi:hypothetical protein
MDRKRFREVVAEALAEVLGSEYPKNQHDKICQIVGLPEMDNEASTDWGAEIMNAGNSMCRIFVDKDSTEEEARRKLKAEIYRHCTASRRAEMLKTNEL